MVVHNGARLEATRWSRPKIVAHGASYGGGSRLQRRLGAANDRGREAGRCETVRRLEARKC